MLNLFQIFAACVTENYKPNIWPLLRRLYWAEGWPVRALVPTLVRVNCQEDLAKNEKLHEKVAEIIKRRIGMSVQSVSFTAPSKRRTFKLPLKR